MNTRSLLMLLAILVVGIASLPAYAVDCGDYCSQGHWVQDTDDDCEDPCAGGEWHWWIAFPYFSGHTYSNWRANGSTMSGDPWGPYQSYYMMFSPNKSGAFGSQCLSWWPCWRCEADSTCDNCDLLVYICH